MVCDKNPIEWELYRVKCHILGRETTMKGFVDFLYGRGCVTDEKEK